MCSVQIPSDHRPYCYLYGLPRGVHPKVKRRSAGLSAIVTRATDGCAHYYVNGEDEIDTPSGAPQDRKKYLAAGSIT